MRVFVVGSNPFSKESKEYLKGQDHLDTIGRALGNALADDHHELVICSPFNDSLDFAVLNGFIERDSHSAIHRHSPGNRVVIEAWKLLLERLSISSVYTYRHPAWTRKEDTANAWLAAQLGALENSDILVALGGRLGGAAEKLLDLASSSGRLFLPLPQLGGSARDAFRKHEWLLRDRLGPDLYQRLALGRDFASLVPAIERVIIGDASVRQPRVTSSFFISYARQDGRFADTAEMTLRRRHLRVFRDEHNFSPDAPLPDEIRDWIQRADVMVVLYSMYHACSPWCYDELHLAFEREPRPEIWMLRLDNTRVVHPKARLLPFFDTWERNDLVFRIENLLYRDAI